MHLFAKTKQIDDKKKSYDSTHFVTNPTAKTKNRISKIVCASLFFILSSKTVYPNFRIKFFNVLLLSSPARKLGSRGHKRTRLILYFLNIYLFHE